MPPFWIATRAIETAAGVPLQPMSMTKSLCYHAVIAA